MSETQRIAKQLQRAFEGNAWHGPSVSEALAGVTAEQAARKPIANAHSIWELVHHLGAWEGILRRRIAGERIVDVPDDQDWPPVRDVSEAAWRAALDNLARGNQLLQQAIAAFPENRLRDLVPGKENPYHVELHGVIEHAAYHAGQIALLKKM